MTDVHRIRSIASCLEMTSEMTRRKVLRTLSFWSLIKHRVIQITKYVQVLHVQKLWVRFHVVRNPQYNKRQEVPRSKKSRRNQENNSINIKKLQRERREQSPWPRHKPQRTSREKPHDTSHFPANLLELEGIWQDEQDKLSQSRWHAGRDLPKTIRKTHPPVLLLCFDSGFNGCCESHVLLSLHRGCKHMELILYKIHLR